MDVPPHPQPIDAARAIPLLVLAGAVFYAAYHSLSWRLTLDAPYMMYLPYQWLEYGLAPYRDVFEHNAPGGFLASGLAYALVGVDDLGVRLIDLSWLAVTAFFTAAALRRFGRAAALAASLLFAGYYLNQGPLVSFQREFQMLSFLALAFAAMPDASAQGIATPRRAALVGLGVGVAAAIKPPALLAAPAFIVWLYQSTPPAQRRGALAAYTAGLLAPIALLAALLASLGGLGAYLEIMVGYYPLYNELSGENVVLAGFERWTYRASEVWHYLATQKRWLVFALLGLGWGALAAKNAAERRLVGAIAVACALGVAYAAALGKFFDYHWLPCHFAAALAGALLLTGRPAIRRGAGTPLATAAVFAFCGWLTFRASPDVMPQWHGKPISQPELIRVDLLTAALRARAKPGDRVQVLEWTNGGAHAALLAGTRAATPFFQDFMFYHHVSTPYVQTLRARFLRAFDGDPPKLVVRVNGDQRACFGPDTVGVWDELELRLHRDYRPIDATLGYVIYQRVIKTPAAAPSGRPGRRSRRSR